jgi:hypothetical protein
MLRSEKLEAGPLMSFSGATRRMFAVENVWVRVFVMPLAWFMWICVACPIYYMGAWLLFPHWSHRQKLIVQARHREQIESNTHRS